jgi:hypothetical protein
MSRTKPVRFVSLSPNQFVWNLICAFVNFFRRLQRQPPSLRCWLKANPAVADSIKWNFQFDTNAYDVPESAKKVWSVWSSAEQQALVQAFEDAWNWYYRKKKVPGKPLPPMSNLMETITYPPVNLNDTTDDTGDPWVAVSADYAWNLYIRWIAVNLLAEIGGHFPWSVLAYSAEQLQVLFDSTAIMSCKPDNTYTLCSGVPEHPNYVKRKDNLGGSLIAPPRYTYAFLIKNNLVGTTRLDTIAKVLQWVSNNLVHFFGDASYGNMDANWQYRGIPPITRVIEGTTSSVAGSFPPFQHWTAGCHGTTGFLRNVLRAANIPVQIVRICGHGLCYFMTENLYLDHGDDPYNLDFKSTGLPAVDLLIDEATYETWFGTNPDNNDTNCSYIGNQVNVLKGT